MIKSGASEKGTMLMTGQKTRSVFDRCNILNDEDMPGTAASSVRYGSGNSTRQARAQESNASMRSRDITNIRVVDRAT